MSEYRITAFISTKYLLPYLFSEWLTKEENKQDKKPKAKKKTLITGTYWFGSHDTDK